MARPPLYVDRTQAGTNLADAINEPGPLDPNLAIPLRAHSIANLAELRKTPGSNDGNGGPRACLLAGQLTPLDAGAGIFIWDATSVLPDNAKQTVTAFTVCNPFLSSTVPGRWRRFVISGGSGITQLTGDGTAGPGSGSQVLTLASVIAGGSFGSTTQVGTFTVDVKGRVTAAANVSIASSVALNQLTGDVTAGPGAGSQVATHVNAPTHATEAGDIIVTAIVAPGTPAAGKATRYVDSTSKNIASKNDAGVINHGIQTRAATANNWIRSVADDGSSTISQPAFTDVSGTATVAQLPNVVIAVQTFTAGGTYTATAGTKSQVVELWGGGGGGSGCVTGTTATNLAFGVGGGAGSYCRRKYTILGAATGTVVIGAAGAAGANTGAIAGAGGNSTFTDGTTLITAPGGTAGPASAAAAATLLITLGAAGSAVATNGDINGRGDQGASGRRDASATIGISGRGGATSLGGAGQERITTGAGNSGATNSGSGGGGAFSNTSASPQTGGAGGTGFCVITEYA